MFTVGVGGDSFARINRSGNFEVGPGRVVPLCMAGDIPAPEQWIGKGHESHLLKVGPSAEKAPMTQSEISFRKRSRNLRADHGRNRTR